MTFLEELKARGLVHQCSNLEELSKKLTSNKNNKNDIKETSTASIL